VSATIGSLCTGYGGLELALGPGYRHAWHTETDDAATRLLKLHHPDVPNHGDIRAVDWSAVEPVDILCAGVPCQAVSAAGKRRGADDARWLWPAALTAIQALRPRVVLFENVLRLTQGDMRPLFDGILTNLHDAGYAVRWSVVGACVIGACHHRHRIFLLATRTPLPVAPRHVLTRTCGSSGRLLPTPVARDGDGRGEGLPDYWKARNVERTSGVPLAVAASLHWEDHVPAVERWATVFGVPVPVPTEPNANGNPRLRAELPEWMMGLRAGYLTDHVARLDALRIAGNGVMPQQAAHAFAILAGAT
jgi:DNA (cytosine-5)-methyltransferase 1